MTRFMYSRFGVVFDVSQSHFNLTVGFHLFFTSPLFFFSIILISLEMISWLEPESERENPESDEIEWNFTYRNAHRHCTNRAKQHELRIDTILHWIGRLHKFQQGLSFSHVAWDLEAQLPLRLVSVRHETCEIFDRNKNRVDSLKMI